MLQSALDAFGIKDTESENFTKEYISKKFKELAKIWHPDRPDGNELKFQEISGYYAMLIAILETGQNQDEQKQTLEMIKAITYHNFS